ncbi:MAG: tRNA 2-selenouridine(34) synthase MnmH [Burkholderiaceae bacterium]
MKDPVIITAAAAIDSLSSFDAILDARSPSEFAEDHLPGAINTPSLDDDERRLVGTVYRQQSPFEARRIGAVIVARNVATLIEQRFADRPRDWRPLVYCWRGGNRSGALATILARVGWRTSVLQGGYREFRREVIAALAQRPAGLRFHVLAGRTGAGKSELLRRLARSGEQVLDLEALARHRGSVLGSEPSAAQPSQKAFETSLWHALRGLDASRPVFVESESRRIGQCHLPDALISAIRRARCTLIDADASVRAELLLRDYQHWVADQPLLFERLDRLLPLHGRERIAQWKALAGDGHWQAFVESLLTQHYDQAYDRSMRRNFSNIEQAETVRIDDASDDALERAVARLRQLAGEAAGLAATSFSVSGSRKPPGVPDT